MHHNRDSVPFRGVVIGRLEGGCTWKRAVFSARFCFVLKENDHLSRQARDKHKEDMLQNGDSAAESGERFIANVGDDPAVFARMMDEGSSCMGATGTVAAGDPDAKQPNLFVFDN